MSWAGLGLKILSKTMNTKQKCRLKMLESMNKIIYHANVHDIGYTSQ